MPNLLLLQKIGNNTERQFCEFHRNLNKPWGQKYADDLCQHPLSVSASLDTAPVHHLRSAATVKYRPQEGFSGHPKANKKKANVRNALKNMWCRTAPP
jgi:hypothetical protein